MMNGSSVCLRITLRKINESAVRLCVSSCASEMERWVEDIRMAIDLAEQSSSPHTDLLSTSPTDNSKPAFVSITL